MRRLPGPPRRRDPRPRGPARLRAHPADARAAHPPREGDLEHLLQPRAQRAGRGRLPLLAGQAGLARAGARSACAAPPTCASGCSRCRASRRTPRARLPRVRRAAAASRQAGSSRPCCRRASSPASTLGRLVPGLDDVLLVAVTEKRTRAEIDAFVDAVAGVIGATAGGGAVMSERRADMPPT